MLTLLRGQPARDIFSAHALRAVYLFGSYARGSADSTSDVDIAVLFDPGGDIAQRFEEVTSLQLELKPILSAPVEVVSLNDENALVAFEAVCRGKDVYSRDADESSFYELQLRHRYEEFCHIQDIFTRALREKLQVF